METGLGYLGIKKWAEEDRPREKLLLKGRTNLSDAELLGILLGSGTTTLTAVDLAKQILSAADNNLHTLAKFKIQDFVNFKGVGTAKAVTIVAALELGRRRKEAEIIKKPVIKSSVDVFELMKPELLDQPHEEFWILLLKRNNEVIAKQQISKGGVSGTVVDAKIIFQKALSALASGVILVHNHPSGNLKPSEQDLRITKKLKEAGKLLDIPVLDHVIFADHHYFSFSDEALI
jgi:DNA repair protein RadC